MKTIIFILGFLLISIFSFGQWYKPYPNNLELWTAKHNTVFAGSQGWSYFLYSTDNILTWDTVYVGHLINCLDADENGKVVIGYNGGILIANNPNGPYTDIMTGTSSFYIHLKNNFIASSAGDRVYLSSDTGQTWTISYNPSEQACYTIRIFNDTTIFAFWYHATPSYCVLWKTDNWGNAWVGKSVGGVMAYNQDMYLKDQYIFIAGSTGVSRSNNNGNSFEAVNTGLPSSNRSIANFISKENALLAGTFHIGVYLTFNYGDNWNAFNDGLDSPYVVSRVAATDSFLYATDNGIWMRPVSQVTGIQEITEQNLAKIYPNPAKDYATINFSGNGITNITICNIFGREMYYHNLQNSKGANSETINVSCWAKGIYIIKASTNKGIKTSKLLVE